MAPPRRRKLLIVIGVLLLSALVLSQTPFGQRWIWEIRRAEIDLKQKESYKKRLAEETEKFEKAKQTRNSDPSTYLQSLSSLSYAYDGVGDRDRANTLRDEAIKVFLDNGDKMRDDDASNAFRWLEQSYRSKRISRSEVESTFLRLLPIANKISYGEYGWPESAFECLSEISEGDNHLRVSLLENWLLVKGVQPLLIPNIKSMLIAAYESVGDLEKSDALQKEKIANAAPESSVFLMINRASFLARHGKREEAEKAVNDAGAKVNWQFSEGDSKSFEYLIKSYESRNMVAERARLFDALLAHPNAQILKVIDPILEKQVDDLTASARLELAEQIIRKRVRAQDQVVSGEPGTYWLMKLSDICLVSGRPGESNRIFESILHSAALMGESAVSIKLQRVALLERLGKVNDAKMLKGSLPKNVDHRAITLKYALLAKRSIDLSGNLTIAAYNSDKGAFSLIGGKGGSICCPGVVRLVGNLSMDGGTVFGSVDMDGRFRAPSVLPVPEEDMNPAPAFMKPRELTSLLPPDLSRSEIVGGDYSATDLRGRLRIPNNPSRPVRIFLRDDTAGSEIANIESANELGKPINFQIWYDGSKRIVLPHNCRIRGIIYAPNARLEMPSNNHEFAGAIVANSIAGEGNIGLHFDEALKGKQLNRD